MAANTNYDDTLNKILREHSGLGGDIKFLNTVFSFMARNSKLFLSPTIDKQISALVKKQSRIARKAHKQKRQNESKPSPSTPLVEEVKSTPSEPVIPSDDEPMKIEVVSDDEDETPTSSSSNSGGKPSSSAAPPAGFDPSVTPDSDDAPPGNGGKTEKYEWTQTLERVEVFFKLPESVRGKDCDVKFTAKRLYVGIKGQEPIVDGEFPKEAEPGDCQWSLGTDADGKTLSLEIGKKDQMGWWSCVVKGDPSIDTQKIRPENSKIDNLDSETQRIVKKMMFDNQQKMMGKPTSDDARKMEALEKFKAQHPEFDFSNAKMS